ncbi:hypothetical protein [Chromatium okenii]|uniref:hypothetical protein n=1 Tax=Chromatium okenii TaxID=61644 RepID=UPI001F5B990B|nr:hypothetical protein [Chromatium okenii]
MAHDDPFAVPDDAGPTVIRPMPGGRLNPPAAGIAQSPQLPIDQSPQPPFSKGGLSAPFSQGGLSSSPFETGTSSTPPFAKGGLGGISSNPLLACANGILTVAAQVRGTASHPDPEGLRDWCSKCALLKPMLAFKVC